MESEPISEKSVLSFLESSIGKIVDLENGFDPDAELGAVGLDSLDFVELQIVLRKAYNLLLSPELFAVGPIKTCRHLAAYIVEHA
jgi:acyl carrier protein